MIYNIKNGDFCALEKDGLIEKYQFPTGLIHCVNENKPFFKMIGKIREIRTNEDRLDKYNNDSTIEVIVDFHMQSEESVINKIISKLKTSNVLVDGESLKCVIMTLEDIQDIAFGLFINT